MNRHELTDGLGLKSLLLVPVTLWHGPLMTGCFHSLVSTPTLAESRSVANEFLDMDTFTSSYSFSRGLLREAAALL